MAGYIAEFFGYRPEDNRSRLSQRRRGNFALFLVLSVQRFYLVIASLPEYVLFGKRQWVPQM